MNKHLNFEVNCETFSANRVDSVGVLKFKKDFIFRASDLTDRDKFLDYLDFLSKNDLIKAVVIIGAPDSKGREEYIEFFHQALTLGKDSNFIHRMLNVVSQIILKIMEMDKIVVHANSGKVLSYFLNIGLACDYSIFAYNTVIQNPCVEMGMAPIGGSAYFLSKILGRSKAYEILLSDKDITAQAALKLGIVDKIVPSHELEGTALETANRFGRKPASLLWGIKRLLNYSYKDLVDYMEFENQMFLKIMHISDFWNNINAYTGISEKEISSVCEYK